VQTFEGFHRFLQTRKAAEIEALFGVRLVCPVDEFRLSLVGRPDLTPDDGHAVVDVRAGHTIMPRGLMSCMTVWAIGSAGRSREVVRWGIYGVCWPGWSARTGGRWPSMPVR
jgi:hypothetical protein